MSEKNLTAGEVAAWISQTTGQSVLSMEQIVGGYSRRTYSVQVGSRSLIARVDMADAPFAGTGMSLLREAKVYQALSKTALPVPALLDVHPAGTALLFERAPGIPQLTELSEESYEAVINDYIDRLAELHTVDPGSIGLASKERSREILDELDRWESILDARTNRPWLLPRLAFRILRQHVPPGTAPAALCHGDAGPKNFLHDGRRVTALLDWEFWHLGDPADDLAWWVFRAHQRGHGGGNLAAQLIRWQQRTGRILTAVEMEYYTVTILTRTMVIVAAGLDQEVSGIDQTVFLGLVPMLSVHILRGLAKLARTPLPALDEPTSDIAAEFGDEAMRLYRRNYLDEPPADAAAALLALTSERYLSHLAAIARFGHSIVAGEAADAADILCLDVESAADVEGYLARVVATGDADEAVIRFLLRREYRRGWLWPSTLSQTTASPIDYAEVLGEAPGTTPA